MRKDKYLVVFSFAVVLQICIFFYFLIIKDFYRAFTVGVFILVTITYMRIHIKNKNSK